MLIFLSVQTKQNLFCSTLFSILLKANLEVSPEHTEEKCKCAQVHTNEGTTHFRTEVKFCLLLAGLHLSPSSSY